MEREVNVVAAVEVVIERRKSLLEFVLLLPHRSDDALDFLVPMKDGVVTVAGYLKTEGVHLVVDESVSQEHGLKINRKLR
jgi:hypothetical protein